MPQSVKKFAIFILNKFGVPVAEGRPYLWNIAQVERIVEYGWVLRNIKGFKILDLGSWGTLFPVQLASLGYKVTGIDLRYNTYSHPNFGFIKGDLFDLKVQKEIIKKGQFDAITLISTLEHIGILFRPKIDLNADIKALKFLKQVLSDEGVILVTVPFGKSKILKRRKQPNERFPGEWMPWLRVYDEERLKDFESLFNTGKVKYFIENDGSWLPASIKQVKNVDYPEFGAKIRSIACIKLMK